MNIEYDILHHLLSVTRRSFKVKIMAVRTVHQFSKIDQPIMALHVFVISLIDSG
jgi:hypothetical protein